MRVFSDTIGIAVIFVLAWLVLYRAGLSWLAPVWAGVWTTISGGMCLYFWQRGGDLDTDRPGRVALVFISLAVGVVLFLLVDALATRTDLFDPGQWPKLLDSRGFLGFTATALLGLGVLSTAVATFVRICMLHLCRFVAHRLSGARKGPAPS
jgi:Trk-type K+ transport system membrane component